MKAIMIVSTYPNKGSAARIGGSMVDSGLAACVNILRISSIYAWKGKTQRASEYMAIFKTTARNRAGLRKKIAETHPYDVPEIAELAVGKVNAPYLRWLAGPMS